MTKCFCLDSTCPTGYWVPPILMTAFLLIANILLMSMLLAIFNNIFENTDRVSKEIWLFQRYRQVMEYESTPFLPPPLTPLYHLWMIFKYIRIKKKCSINSRLKPKTNSKLFDFALKLFLNADEVEKIHDFEEECMEDLAREKEYKKNTSTEERIHRTAERTDLVLLRLNDLASKDSALKSLARDFDRRLEVLENRQRETLDYVRQLASTLGKVSPSSSGYGFSPVPQSVGSADDRTQASPSSALGGTDTAQLQRPGFLPRPDPVSFAVIFSNK
ncbi:unnamed protein product [Gongylonema pulchrum]|uniref:Ion_trans domain-containing protein n=1 Tax=Gongylonema pulchrum TaxID=637853 RepID=A0A183CYI6_9BILA|nr:unnamed protein product [Gongylonema pulchrum]